MGNLVSYYKSHKSPNGSLQVTDTDKAILDMRIARKQLVTYKRQQEQLIERSQHVVGELLKKQLRDLAVLALRKKKLHERQVLQLDQNILKLDEQVVALETTEQQVDTVSALRKANQAMKAMQQQMPLDAIEKLMQENVESAQYVEQVNTMLEMGPVDGTDVDAELAALEAEMADEQAASMPSVPTNVQPAAASAAKPDVLEPNAADGLPTPPMSDAEIAEQPALVPA